MFFVSNPLFHENDRALKGRRTRDLINLFFVLLFAWEDNFNQINYTTLIRSLLSKYVWIRVENLVNSIEEFVDLIFKDIENANLT